MVEALARLREHYAEGYRGVVLREVAGGFTLATDPVAERAARRLLAKPRTPPLTQAQAECLAIVAYLQPVSRPEIARIRGVASESAVGTLLERGLIEESGRSRFGAVLYRTTELFESLFGLSGLDALPDPAHVRPHARGGGRAARAPAARRRAARARRRPPTASSSHARCRASRNSARPSTRWRALPGPRAGGRARGADLRRRAGPRRHPAVLDALDDRGLKATFFMVGEQADRAPGDRRARWPTSGHEVALHGYEHVREHADPGDAGATTWRAALARRGRDRARARRCFRPPYGRFSEDSYDACWSSARAVYGRRGGWTGSRSGPDRIAELVVRDLEPGAIVLLHDSARYAPRDERRADGAGAAGDRGGGREPRHRARAALGGGGRASTRPANSPATSQRICSIASVAGESKPSPRRAAQMRRTGASRPSERDTTTGWRVQGQAGEEGQPTPAATSAWAAIVSSASKANARLEAGVLAGALVDRPAAGLAARHDPGLVGEVGQPQAAARGQRMALGQDHVVRVVEQVGQRQVLVEHPGDALEVVDQREVDLAGAHGLAGLVGLGHDHPQLDVGVAAVELRHGAGEERGAGALERGQPQPPAAQARDRGQLVLGVLDAGEDRVGVGDQRARPPRSAARRARCAPAGWSRPRAPGPRRAG